MPRGSIPADHQDILESTTLGHLATVGSDGRPQVNPVWFLWDGEHVLLSVKGVTAKYRNILRDPRVAISFVDPSDPQRYVEVRGTVTDIELYRTLEFVNLLSQKYTGSDFPASEEGKARYKLTVKVDSWTGQ